MAPKEIDLLPIFAPIVGHADQRNELRQLFTNKTLPHALLFDGPEGIGKKRVALELATILLCKEKNAPCGECASCRTAKAQTHPDFAFINCEEKETISADATRTLLNRFLLAPALGGARVIILDNAHLLPPVSANALLKTLEEPTANTFFILLTGQRNKILPTILSRCRVVRFFNLEAEDFANLAKPLLAELSDGEQRMLYPLAQNSLTTLKNLIADKEFALAATQQLDKVLRAIPGAAFGVTTLVQGEKELLAPRLTLLIKVVGSFLKQAISQAQPEIAKRATTLQQRLIAAYHLIFERNVTPQSVLLASLFDLKQEEYKLPG